MIRALKDALAATWRARQVAADFRSFAELAYVMSLALIDRRKTAVRRFLLVWLPGLILRAARNERLLVHLRMNGKTVKVFFAHQSATEFWSIRSIITEVLIKKVYQPHSNRALQTVVDAGANIGLATLYLYTLFPQAHFYCYEPSSETFALLLQNLSLNGVRAQAFQKALTDHEGSVNFEAGRSTMERGIVSNLDETKMEHVACAALGTEMGRLGLGKIDLLKFDVEGEEVRLLEGLGDRLSEVGEIVGETHNVGLEMAVNQILRSAGFITETKEGHVRGFRRE